MSTTHTAPAAQPVTTGSRAAHRIPPPDGRREPLKTNVFERMTGSAAQLLPLFPYHDAGAIVPCGAIFTGDPDDAEFGHFFHWNTVEELTVCFGSKDAMLQTGQIFANQSLHGVNSFLRNPDDPNAFAVLTITQRQVDEGSQREALLFRCQKCHEQLLRFEYNSTPQGLDAHEPAQWGGSADDDPAVFITAWGGVEFVHQLNDESVRTCAKCGHVNDEFPELKWGWKRFVNQTRSANRSKAALRTAIQELNEKKAV